MATTGKNFVRLTSSTLTGSGYATNGVALAMPPASAQQAVNSGVAQVLDKVTVDFSKSSWAKNGCVVLNLAASTPVTVDLTNLGAQTVTAGDLAFATGNELVFNNLGADDVKVTPGASNPFSGPLSGTSPGFNVPANAQERWHSPAGWTIDPTHKTLTFDPGPSPATIALVVGGA